MSAVEHDPEHCPDGGCQILALTAERDALAAKVARARKWIETCVDPVVVSPMVKRAMLDYLDGKRDVPHDLSDLAEDTTAGITRAALTEGTKG